MATKKLIPSLNIWSFVFKPLPEIITSVFGNIVYLMFFDANNLILEFKLTNTNISYKWYSKQLMSISPPLRYNSSPMIRPRIFPIVYFKLSEWICSSFLFNCGKHILCKFAFFTLANSRRIRVGTLIAYNFINISCGTYFF